MFEILNDRESEVELLEAALNSYGLLFTRTDNAPEKEYFEEIMDKHMEFLEGDSIDVRIAAGENLALIMEATEVEYDSLGELLQVTNDLFNQSSKYIAKKDKSAQKSSFRNILESIKGGIVPETELKFGNQTVIFKGWEKLRQLEFLRRVIKEGLVTLDNNLSLFISTKTLKSNNSLTGLRLNTTNSTGGY